ncbi:MAG: DUF4040 domain-containing protein [Bacteroidales bacterium]|jgi:uncharacterized MnhB-related membrane protein|nr:DUF4040 domain-containing protein [Bacteroidales bacterium]
MIYEGIILLLSLVMVVMALIAIYHRKIEVAVIASGVVSLVASVVFLFLSAPDVAITEAAIGSALTVAIFFYVIHKTKQTDDKK